MTAIFCMHDLDMHDLVTNRRAPSPRGTRPLRGADRTAAVSRAQVGRDGRHVALQFTGDPIRVGGRR